MQIAAIPTGPLYYQPIAPVPPIAKVVGKAEDPTTNATDKLRATPRPGLGSLLDIEA